MLNIETCIGREGDGQSPVPIFLYSLLILW